MNSKVFINYGCKPFENTVSLLEHMNAASFIPEDAVIGIKPNIEFAKTSETGATTDPGIIDAIIYYLKLKDFKNIIILGGSCESESTEKVFKICGYRDIAERNCIKLVDLQKDSSIPVKTSGRTIFVCSEALGVDFMINVPVLKGDSRIKMSASLSNMAGCVPNAEKRRFSQLGVHESISVVNCILKSDLIIVDSIEGDLDFEEGGTPVNLNRILGGLDPVLVDSYCASLMGIPVREIDYITMSEKLGEGSSKLNKKNIIELNKNKDSEGIKTIKKIRFSKFVYEKEACPGCYAGLVHALSRMRENNELSIIDSRIYIGRYFSNKRSKNNGIGIGDCCSNFDRYVKGCPPSAGDIVEFLRKL